MLEQLKHIKEKLNLLILEVEKIEKAIHGEETILERKDFKFIKRKGTYTEYNITRHVFEFFEGIVFSLPDDKSNSYLNTIFNNLINGTLERIILKRRIVPYNTKNGFLITHNVEQEVDTKLREAYREI